METREIHENLIDILSNFDRICQKYNIWYTLAAGSILGAIRHKGFIPWDLDVDVFVKKTDLDKIRQKMKEELPANYNYIEWDKEKGYSLPFDRIGHSETPHQVLHLDLFPIIGSPTNKIARKIFTRLCFLTYKANHCKHVDINYSNPSNIASILRIRKFVRIIPSSFFKITFHFLNNLFNLKKSDYFHTIGSGYGYKGSMKKKVIMETIKVPFENLILPIPVHWDEYLSNLYGDYMTPVREGFKKN